jgi:hypothetical protein
MGCARAKVTFVPSPYDNQALKFKVTIIISFSSIFYFVIIYFVEDLDSLQVKNSFDLSAS